MNFAPPPSRLVERQCNDSYEYVLTVNDIVAVCPYKSPVPQQENGQLMSFSFSACGSSCPLFCFDSEASPKSDKNAENNEKLFIHLGCGNGLGRHLIKEVVYLPKTKNTGMFAQNVVEVEGEELDNPPKGKVFKL